MRRKVWIIVALVGVLAAAGIMVAIAADEKGEKARGGKGYLGVFLGELTSDVATDYGVRAGEGVLVEGVTPGSPAAEAGLRENDVIIRMNNLTPTGPEEFRQQIAKLKPDDTVQLVYLRGGKEKTASVKLSGREEPDFEWGPGRRGERRFQFEGPPWEWHRDGTREPQDKFAYAGIVCQEISGGLAEYFQVEKGALVSEVVKDSPAEKAGMKAGDVILRIGETAVEDQGDVRRAIRDHKPGEAIDFQINRHGQPMTMKVTLGEQVGWHSEHMFGMIDAEDFRNVIPPEDLEALRKDLEKLRIEIEAIPDIDVEHFRGPPVRIRIDSEGNSIESKDRPRTSGRLRDRLSDAFQRLSKQVDTLMDRAFV